MPLYVIFSRAHSLNKEEITILQEPSDRYRAFRSLNLRELNFSRLLSRREFPYDIKRRFREKESEQSQPREDLFYDIEKNKFVRGRRKQNEISMRIDLETTNLSQREVRIFDSKNLSLSEYDCVFVVCR